MMAARLDPIKVMESHGFSDEADVARGVLPEDWMVRWSHSPKIIAAALTYYVGFQDYTQMDVKQQYDISLTGLRSGWKTLKEDLGLPGEEDSL